MKQMKLSLLASLIIGATSLISCAKKDRAQPINTDRASAGRLEAGTGEASSPEAGGSETTTTEPEGVVELSDSIELCKPLLNELANKNWTYMRIDVSEVYDKNTSEVLSEEDITTKGLNTVLEFVRPQVKFSLDEAERLLKYTYESANGETVERALAVLASEGNGCVLGIDNSRPEHDLRDFANGTVQIKSSSDPVDLKSLEIEWVNPYFIQKGRVHLEE